mmetsp:Transcript_11497/g.27451  ORF Transcript_11497/g.27451 Transcript_11497/m.27451 type:complete len:106 (+) Transcript_11497:43-360(+)
MRKQKSNSIVRDETKEESVMPDQDTKKKLETKESHRNVQATVITHHVIAPGRSPRSGNVASTKGGQASGRTRTSPYSTPSRYIELSAIAYTSENPSEDGQCESSK